MKMYASVLLILALSILIIPIFAKTGPTQQQPPSQVIKAAQKDRFLLLDQGKVLDVSARDFLIGAVATEMMPTYHLEALKAQAVAAYTYTARIRDQQLEKPSPELKGAYYEVNSSKRQGFMNKQQLKERWGNNFDLYYKRMSEAVDAVLGYEMRHEGKPVLAAYHSISGGKTETAANVWGDGPSYLAAVDSAGDLLAPNYKTVVTLTDAQMEKMLTTKWKDIKLDSNPLNWFGNSKKSDSGTVLSVAVGNKTVKGVEVRAALNLRSANFTVTHSDGQFTVTVLGYGHGVGMSQYGADYMARQGSDWKSILNWYYKDIEIVKAF